MARDAGGGPDRWVAEYHSRGDFSGNLASVHVICPKVAPLSRFMGMEAVRCVPRPTIGRMAVGPKIGGVQF
jgi:hypothetical protein